MSACSTPTLASSLCFPFWTAWCHAVVRAAVSRLVLIGCMTAAWCQVQKRFLPVHAVSNFIQVNGPLCWSVAAGFMVRAAKSGICAFAPVCPNLLETTTAEYFEWKEEFRSFCASWNNQTARWLHVCLLLPQHHVSSAAACGCGWRRWRRACNCRLQRRAVITMLNMKRRLTIGSLPRLFSSPSLLLSPLNPSSCVPSAAPQLMSEGVFAACH